MAAHAADPPGIDWKLTYTHHVAQQEKDGMDLNLRGTHEASLRTQAVTLASEVSEALHGYRAHDAAATLPDADRDAWQARVAQILPLGEGRIAADATTTNITVLWTAHDSSEQIQLSIAP